MFGSKKHSDYSRSFPEWKDKNKASRWTKFNFKKECILLPTLFNLYSERIFKIVCENENDYIGREFQIYDTYADD